MASPSTRDDGLALCWVEARSAGETAQSLADALQAVTGSRCLRRTEAVGQLLDRLRQQWTAAEGGARGLWRGMFRELFEASCGELPMAAALDDPWLEAWMQALVEGGAWQVLAGWRDAHAEALRQPTQRARLLTIWRHFRAMSAVAQCRHTLALATDFPWTREFWDAVVHLARQAQRLEDLAWAAAQCMRQLQLPDATDERPARAWLAAAVVGNRTAHLPLIRQTCQRLLALPDSSDDTAQVVAAALATLAVFDDGDDTSGLLEQAGARWPRKPIVQLERAKLARLRGADEAAVQAMLAEVDDGVPGFRAAMSWLANVLFHEGLAEAAEDCFLRLERNGPLNPADRLRLVHLQSRGQSSAASPAPEAPGPAFDPAVLAPLEHALDSLREVLIQPTWHTTDEALAHRMAEADAAVHRSRAALAAMRPASLDEVLALAQRLMTLADEGFANHDKWLDAFPFELGPAYGRVDGRISRVIRRALHAHVALLFEWVLGWPAPLTPAPGGAGLRSWLVLCRLAVDALLMNEDLPAAWALVVRARKVAGPVLGHESLERLEQRCHLAAGDLDRVQSADQGGVAKAGEGHALREWEAWCTSEHLAPSTLFVDRPLSGGFETVAPDGACGRAPHAVPETALALVNLKGARIRLSHGLIGPAGTMLLPHQWHRMMGDYPYNDPAVLNRAARGTVLRPAPEPRTITTPVLVLANMDALQHRNYYHWTLFLLARACWLHDHGHLQGRQLLVPREMSSWMFSGLADVGIPADALLTYGRDEALVLEDARVASPIEFASPTLLEHLRLRLWRAAGLDPDAPPPQDRLLHVSRRGENRRPLVEEDALCALAAERGFEVVDPGAMPLLDQVRLFARARAIVSPPGAALTNLIWCQPGVRLLVVFKEEAAPPFFVDLALLRGLHYRWLMGRNLPAYRMSHVVNAPFSVDLGLAARHLDWAAGGD